MHKFFILPVKWDEKILNCESMMLADKYVFTNMNILSITGIDYKLIS